MRRCTGAPRCLFRLPASVFESDPLIYPATLFWRRFGSLALVGGISFSAKFICMGKSGVGPDFASPPYKRCAHFAHFAETLCRVVRDPLAGGHAPWGLRPLPPTARGGATGDDLPCGGRPTLHPPGHTPGHCGAQGRGTGQGSVLPGSPETGPPRGPGQVPFGGVSLLRNV